MLTIVVLTLVLGMMPFGIVLAAEPGVWVLVETQFEPQNKNREWEQQFLDSVTTQAVTLTTGQKLLVMQDGTETVIPFTDTEIDSLMKNYKLDEPALRSYEELEALFDESANGDTNGFPIVPVIIGIAVITGGAAFLTFKKRRKA